MMKIRQAMAAEAEEIRALIVEAAASCHEDFEGPGLRNFLVPNSVEEIRRRVNTPGYVTLVCEIDEVLAGMITIRLPDKIDQLFVHHAHRRKGVAHRLWREARSHCEAAGLVPRYWVKSSSMGVAVYQSFGFRIVGDRQSENGISYYPMVLEPGEED